MNGDGAVKNVSCCIVCPVLISWDSFVVYEYRTAFIFGGKVLPGIQRPCIVHERMGVHTLIHLIQ